MPLPGMVLGNRLDPGNRKGCPYRIQTMPSWGLILDNRVMGNRKGCPYRIQTMPSSWLITGNP